MADRIKGITIELDGETTGLKAALSDITSKSISVQKELTDVNRLLKFDPGNTAALAQKQELLAKQVEVTSQKLQSLKNAEQQVDEQFRAGNIGESQYRAFQREIEFTSTSLNKLKDNLKQVDLELTKTTENEKKFGNTAEIEKFKTSMGGVNQSVGSLKTSLVGSVATIGLTTAGIVEFGKKGIELASNLTEVQNVVDTTFGDNAEKVNKWAQSAATSFGIGELSAKQMTGTLGAMLKSMGLSSDQTVTMSESMVGLSGDFASFYNLKPEEAFEKIRSGISGETEPLKQLGINMSETNLSAFALSQGINKQYKEMTQAEQATLRYNYLMSVSKDAQGDFAKTSDSTANQLRIMELNMSSIGAKFGELLIPAVQKGAQSFNGIADKMKGVFSDDSIKEGITSLAESIGNFIEKIANFVVDNLPTFIDGLKFIADNANNIATALIAVGTGMKVFAITEMVTKFASEVGKAQEATKGLSTAQAILNVAMKDNPIGFVISVISSLIAAVIYLWNTNDGFRDAVIGAWNKIKEVFNAVIDWIAPYWNTFIDGLKIAFDAFMQFITPAWNGFKIVFGLVVDAIKFVWDAFVSSLKIAWDGFKIAWDAVCDALKPVIDPIIDSIKKLWDNFVKGVKVVWDDLKAAWDKLCDDFNQIIGPVLDDLKKKWDDYKTTVQKIFDDEKAGWDKLCNALSPVLTPILNQLKLDWNGFKLSIVEVVNGVQIAWNTLCNALGPVMTPILEQIKLAWDGFKVSFETVINGVKYSWDTVSGAIKSSWDTVVEGVKTAWDGIKQPFQDVCDWIGNIWEGIRSKFKLPHFTVSGSLDPLKWESEGKPSVGVEWYANGGIMTSPTLFGFNGNNAMVGGEAGPEAILPLDSLYKNMSNIVNNALTKLNTSNSYSITNNMSASSTGNLSAILAKMDSLEKALNNVGIYMDSREIGKLVTPAVSSNLTQMYRGNA